jgi:hypothetical protein
VASRIVRVFEAAMFPLGALALGVLVWQTGKDEILRLTATVQWWFALIVLQELVAHSANTAGLLACLPLDRKGLGFGYTFAARLAGEGVNATMPTATVGGELLKIALLSRRAPAERVTAGVSAAYTGQTFAQMLFTALALPFALPWIPWALPYRLMLAFFVFSGLIVTYAIAVVSRGSAFGSVHSVLRKLKIGKEGSSAHETTGRIDDAAKQATVANPHAFSVSVILFLFAWFWGTIEVAVILHACRIDVDLSTCAAIESLSAFIDAAFFFVPGQMGTREGGLAGITHTLGLGTPAGLTIGLVRRGRVFIWAALGLVCLAWFRRNAPKGVTPSNPIQPATQAANGGEHETTPDGSRVVRDATIG